MRTLTDRQERFIHEYLLDQNASAAAGRAGYSAKARGAHATAMMKNPLIRERIVVELSDLYARLKLNAVEVLRAQVRSAYLDPAKLFDAAQQAIPLAALDEDTRGGLTVTYTLKDNGQQLMRVKQTPRHIALAALQKRLDAFEKLQAAVFAAAVPAAASDCESPTDDEAQAFAPAEAGEAEAFALGVGESTEIVAPTAFVPAAVEQAEPVAATPSRAAGAAGGVAPARALGPGPRWDSAAPPPAPAPEPAVFAAADEAIAEAARGIAVTPVARPVPVPVAASSAEGPVKARTSASVADMVDHAAPSPAPAAQADLMARDHDAPPSPYDPAYDFRNDPNAMSGGRWPAWNKYQKEKHEPARQVPVPDETARPGLRSAAERIGPARMVPGYNPPWAREGRPNTRPPFAMETAEAGRV